MEEGQPYPSAYDRGKTHSIQARTIEHNNMAVGSLPNIIRYVSRRDEIRVLPPKILSEFISVGGAPLFEVTLKHGYFQRETSLCLTSTEIVRLVGWVDQGRSWRTNKGFLRVQRVSDAIVERIRRTPGIVNFDEHAPLGNP